jgi:YggT family protein
VGILSLIGLLLQLYSFIMLARVLLSWFPNIDRSNPIIQLLYDLTEPVLRPIRQAIPPERTGMMDVSPIIVFLIIYLLRSVLL